MAEISKNIEQAVALLNQNEVVAIPTETVYGLAANALQPEATERIYTTKNRPSSNPLIMHIKNVEELGKYTKNIPEKALVLAKMFWPGPLTLLLEKKDIVPNSTTSGSQLIALRVPKHPITLKLLNQLDFPLAAPSANPFGYISPTRAEHVQHQIGDKIELILDGGPCEKGLESTIVGFKGTSVIIYRPGYITQEDLQAVVGKNIDVQYKTDQKVVTSGMLPYHYSPNTPLVLIDDESEIISNPKSGLITYGKAELEMEHLINLSPNSSLEEAAQKLYSSLIEMDGMGLDTIYCKKYPNEGLGITLNERLKKAANKIEHLNRT